MFIKRKYSLTDLITWTRQETVLLTLIALIPVVVYEVFDQKWLHLPWLPIAVVGTAVAFIISFQNNATYDRVWEARKIWGGIVNTSRAWGIEVNDFITNDFVDEKVTARDEAVTTLGALPSTPHQQGVVRDDRRAGTPVFPRGRAPALSLRDGARLRAFQVEQSHAALVSSVEAASRAAT
jgi:hypothetical protein